MSDLLYKDESYRIIGKCFEVHNNLGAGFLKSFTKMLWNMNSTVQIFHSQEK